MSSSGGRLAPAIRYGVPGVLLLAGLIVPFVESDTTVALEISGMFIGAAFAVLLVGMFVRIGNQGEQERDREEDARRYLDEHGHWPDEKSQR